MEYVKREDYLKVYKAGEISNVDFQVVTLLYQPLIGYKASMLYFTLVNFANSFDSSFLNHEYLFNMMGMDVNDFIPSRRKLEAMGLIKTYVNEGDEYRTYSYVIYCPKSPYEFFNDALFKGLLNIYLGEKELQKLSKKYEMNFDVSSGREITADFNDVFSPNLDDPRFDVNISHNQIKNKAIELTSNFNDEDFYAQLSEYMMNENSLSEKEYDIIKSVSLLYGLNVITICDIVAEIYDKSAPKGKRINMEKLIARAMDESKFSLISNKNKQEKSWVKISGKTRYANEIEIMQNKDTSPIKYLQFKQNGAAVAMCDKKLINYLKFDIKLPDSVINAIIYYTLKMCNNRFNKNYVEKIATSLKREGVSNALDALNYLENPKQNVKYKKVIDTKTKDDDLDKNNDDDSYSDEEYDKLLESFTKRK